MELEEILTETLKELLKFLDIEFSDIEINEEEKDLFAINIKSDNPSMLIGHHGENIKALQHILKVLAWKKQPVEKQFNILLDVDNYRQRQEENVIAITDRKIDILRKTGRKQILPPMSPYFRRKIHLHCMSAGCNDIETTSDGEGEQRHVVIKLK